MRLRYNPKRDLQISLGSKKTVRKHQEKGPTIGYCPPRGLPEQRTASDSYLGQPPLEASCLDQAGTRPLIRFMRTHKNFYCLQLRNSVGSPGLPSENRVRACRVYMHDDGKDNNSMPLIRNLKLVFEVYIYALLGD